MDRRREQAVYVISVAAELAGVHPQTLRIYERRGLLEPSRSRGGNRRYSDIDIARLRRIAELTEEGLNLAGVKRVMDLENEVAFLHARVRDLERENREIADRVARGYRRDLVPLNQQITRYGQLSSIIGKMG
jgi:MerR family transcriptional regulator, heat shock protein HspR